MAKINFSALVDSIIGKLGGSVFQYSQGGWQVHVIGKPRNPQTNYQQLRRGNFGFLSSSWRNLTTIQRQTFIDNVPTGISALDFFIRTNVNLSLINEPTVTSFVPAAAPTDFPIDIIDVNPTQYNIKASGMTTVVPAGMKLLVYTTPTKAQTKIFTNPSEYSPIISIDEGTDLSTPLNIISAYNDRFGQLPGEMYLCNKTVLIDKANGQRGAESIVCSNTEEMPKFTKIYSNFTPAGSVGTGATDVFSFNIPANSLVKDGDCLSGFYWGHSAGGGVNHLITLTIAGVGIAFAAFTVSAVWRVSFNVIRLSSTDGYYVAVLETSAGSVQVGEGQFGLTDWTTIQVAKLTLQAPVSGSITCDSGYINKELI